MKNSLGTLAAVAALATAAQLDAAIVVSPVQNQMIPESGYLYIDITGDGSEDFFFNGNADRLDSIWDGTYVTLFAANSGSLLALAPGSVVDANLETYASNAGYGNLANAGTVFAGFSLLIEGNIHYGWLEFDFDASGINTLVGGAWESVAGEGIVVGAIPEPTTVGLASGLVAAAAVLAHRRLRRRSR